MATLVVARLGTKGPHLVNERTIVTSWIALESHTELKMKVHEYTTDCKLSVHF